MAAERSDWVDDWVSLCYCCWSRRVSSRIQRITIGSRCQRQIRPHSPAKLTRSLTTRPQQSVQAFLRELERGPFGHPSASEFSVLVCQRVLMARQLSIEPLPEKCADMPANNFVVTGNCEVRVYDVLISDGAPWLCLPRLSLTYYAPRLAHKPGIHLSLNHVAQTPC